MKSLKDEFKHTLATALSSDRDCILIGEVRGYNEELMKSTSLSSAWDSSQFDKSLGIKMRLEDMIVAHKVD